uniref:Helicase C-terminal domain-containing protein n=1 Tax=Amphimedon queenslandica TaxID=400682 RepID=A0A1X7UFP8_AMPQE
MGMVQKWFWKSLYCEQILYLVEKYCTAVIVGETGSGKTTQLCFIYIPQYPHEANWTGNGYIVAVPQPKRIAVTTDGSVLRYNEEVETDVKLLKEHAERVTKGLQLLPLPLYGGLPYSEQIQVFQQTPLNSRKVIVSTNIAETSVTINESLVIVPRSQSSALQTSGRAGRVCSGKRSHTELLMLPCTAPEVQRSSMAPVMLQLNALRIDNVLRFNYLSSPPAKSLLQGLELLYALGGRHAYNVDACGLAYALSFLSL